MRISLTRGLKIDLGGYESLTISATVTVDHGDLGITDEELVTGIAKRSKLQDELLEELQIIANKQIELLLKDDIEQADLLTIAPNSVLKRL